MSACRKRSPNTEAENRQHEAFVILLLFHVRGPGIALTPQVNRPEILAVPYRISFCREYAERTGGIHAIVP